MTTRASLAFTTSGRDNRKVDPYTGITPADLRSCVNLVADDHAELLGVLPRRPLRVKTVAKKLGWLPGRTRRACRAHTEICTIGDLVWRRRPNAMR